MTGNGQPDRFWADLARTRDELRARSVSTPGTVGVVGPLVASVPVVRRLQRQLAPGSSGVVVLTPRAELVSEPTWTLVRNGSQLAEAAHRPAVGILVIDVAPPLPRWLGPLVDRLRRIGLGLIHHAVEGEPDDADLAAARDVLGGPLVLDLASPVGPERLVSLLDGEVPVTSVRSVPLSAELALAARLSSGRH